MAPTIVTDDYYAILGVVMTADTQAIRSAYRRLARVTHPDKNQSPNGKEEFQRLQAAYETLSDPTKRRAYDVQRPKPSTSSRPSAGTASRGTPQRETGSTSQTTSQEANSTPRTGAWTQALETLRARWTRQDMDIFEARRNVRKLETEINRLQEEDAAEAREAGNPAGWWGNMSSFLFGAGPEGIREPQEVREERERRRLNRSAAIRIKSMEILNKTNRLHALETAAESTAMAMAELRQRIRFEEQKQEDEKAAQAQRKMQEEALKRAREAEAERQRKREQEERERNERERKKREQREREQREREQKERERVEREQKEFSLREEIFRRTRERLEREFNEQLKKSAESRKAANNGKAVKNQQQQQQHRASKSSDKSQSTCLHRGWWTQIPGRAVCSICSETLAKFALECPGCHIKACVSCKRKIQPARR